jgi:hypothetical protein
MRGSAIDLRSAVARRTAPRAWGAEPIEEAERRAYGIVVNSVRREPGRSVVPILGFGRDVVPLQNGR